MTAPVASRRFALSALLLSFVLVSLGIHAQPSGLAADQGYVGLGMALRQLSTVSIFMQGVAHPDDENNGLLVMLKRGLGVRTALVTATRGDGGQNEIGPELGDALGVLRTAELMSVHRFDGAEQYFTRAVDFGYSFSLEETFRKWGREEITSDFVRLIRTIRPDVIMAMRPDGTGGGQHHQASAIIVGDAFRAAADPAKFPDQIREGLRPWQPKKLYYMQSFGGAPAPALATPAEQTALLRIDSEVWDPLLGSTFAFLGSEARSMHKCQGMGQLLALPGPSVMTYRLGDSVGAAQGRNASLFDGIDGSLASLAQYAGATPPEALTSGLAAIASAVGAAVKAFSAGGPAATLQPLVNGLGQVRALRAALPKMAGVDGAAQYEIDFRLKTKEQQFQDAILLAQGLQFDVLADDGQVVAGQPVSVRVIIANRGDEPVQLKALAFQGLQGRANCVPGAIAPHAVYRCDSPLTIPADARLTTPYWKRLPDAARYEFEPGIPFGVPFTPNPFNARIDFDIDGGAVTTTLPVQYRYEGNVFSGEKRMTLQVVPALSVRLTPDITIVPTGARTTTTATTSPTAPKDGAAQPGAAGSAATARSRTAQAINQPLPADQREVRVSVTSGARGAANAVVTLQMPGGWQATPAEAKVNFAREDEAQTVRFLVRPASGTRPGAYRMKAIARLTGSDGQPGAAFDQGYQVIEYQHVEHHQMNRPAEATVKLIDVKVRPRLLVGYVMGTGDQVPPALEQLGAQVDLLDSDDLAWGNLSRYDAIVTGVRAYERREDLRQHNQRLLDYVAKGGTLVVQYNKFEFNQAQYGPYPAKVSSNRVTDENAPVQVLQPANPIFNSPNRIGPAAWQGWVQERGLYFLGEKDPRYVDLVQMEDPFPYNAGIKRGALVEATYGKGHWIYVGLNLWRQLPAGTDGAYQLFANLISLRAGQ